MKYSKISEVLTSIVDFSNKHNIEIIIRIFEISELTNNSDHQDEYWAKFEKYPGVYCFFQNNIPLYAGMSESNTGSRIFKWLFEDNKIAKRLNKNDLVLLISFDEQNYMAPALESFIIQKFHPELNKQKSK